MAVYTFVGPIYDRDWRLTTIKIGTDTYIGRGESADLTDEQVAYLSNRYKLVPGTGATPDPVINPLTSGGDGSGTGSVGPAGPKGAQGDPGPAGAAGAQGVAGVDGVQGAAGAAGAAGAKGDPGENLGLSWMDVAGHSIAGAGGGRLYPDSGYAYRTRSALGIREFRDLSNGGAVACWPNAFATGDGGYPHILRNMLRPGSAGMGAAAGPYVPQSQIALIHFGLNDLAVLGPNKPLPFITAMRTIMARYCAAAVFEDDNAAWAYTGTWAALVLNATVAASSGTGAKYTTTVGDKATFTLPADYPAGRVVGIGLFLNATWAANTYGIRVDGVDYPDVVVTPANICDTATNASKHMIHTLRIGRGVAGDPALAAGAHTIELTLKAGPGLAIDFAHIEADPLSGPLLVVPLLHKVANYALWSGWTAGGAMNDAAVDTFNAALTAFLAEFPGRTIPIDIDATAGLVRAIHPAGDYISDGAHPTERGHGKIAAAVRAAILSSGLITDQIREFPSPLPKTYFRKIAVLGGAGAFGGFWASTFGAGAPVLEWSRRPDRSVQVRGTVKANAGAGATILGANVLPKPLENRDFQMPFYDAAAWTSRTVRVGTDGSLTLLNPVITTAGNALSIDLTYEVDSF